MLISSLVVAVLIVGPGTGKMKQTNKQRPKKKTTIAQATSRKAHAFAVRMMALLLEKKQT